MEIVSKLGQTYVPPSAALALQGPAATANKPKLVYQVDGQQSVFQVNNPQDEVYNVKLSVEQIYLSSQIKATNMVVDTGSTYNLIGQQLLPILDERLQAGGHKLKLEETLKYFKFGGHDNIECKTKVNIPLSLADITKNIEVYIVPEKIPFLIGGQTLRSMEAKIDLAPNTLTVDGRRIQMDLTPSGHMTLPWNGRSHYTKQVNQVHLTQKVSRKEFNQPEVMTAMIKEITNLNNNGTYTEVKQEPWQPIVDTMWVINKSTEDDGKNAGRIKARLVVRGDQDAGEDDIRCDSPTVDRTTVKFMLALAANQGFEIRAVDISAAFLQGRELDREVYVRPLPEFKKPGVVWKLLKGLYGLKEAARLWYDKLTKTMLEAGGQRLIGDPACFLFFENGQWIGFVMVHVDDIIPEVHRSSVR
jgi:hypothetical protein